MADEEWRIDDLAHRSGVSVDTIRFYQREGLLPPAARHGRATVYGPAHLHRIEQIRDLQARHFNLAAVKALLTESRLGAIQALFSEEGTFTRAQLIDAAGVDETIVAGLEEAGFLAGPALTGRLGYDRADLDALVAIGRLIQLGMPRQVALFLARLYAVAFAEMREQVAALFSGEGEIDWAERDRAEFIEQLDGQINEVFDLTARLLNYAHHTTVRRMTLTVPLPNREDAP